ncbi:hypothetical protein EYC84_011612 [Monilinia fructicola]|uniref:Uncharacterized protein n=1 Tax=Monilinia fructicola TaxID=38448 RepID=A0A5M9J7B7_MONFR|nr:hypothetical protein EYC84_011612 [Monilinia fructicola]
MPKSCEHSSAFLHAPVRDVCESPVSVMLIIPSIFIVQQNRFILPDSHRPNSYHLESQNLPIQFSPSPVFIDSSISTKTTNHSLSS